jgi:hypothetical protein
VAGIEANMDDNEFDLFADSAIQEFKEKQHSLETKNKFNFSARWMFDLERAMLKFFDKNDQLDLTCEVIEIGSFSLQTHSWKWAWSNDSLPPKLRGQALPLKQLHQITGREGFF